MQRAPRMALLLGLALTLCACRAVPNPPAGAAAAFRYGPWPARPALHYFRRWGEGTWSRRLGEARRTGVAAAAFGAGEPTDIAGAWEAHTARLCGAPTRGRKDHAWELHSTAADPSGAVHAVLRSRLGGSMQYVALWGGSVLAVDPPAACPDRTAAVASNSTLTARRLAVQPGALAGGSTPVESFVTGGRRGLLHPKHDDLVQDCEKLFHRTAADRCGRAFDVQVVSASLSVIDGFAVDMKVGVAGAAGGGGGERLAHAVTCAFEHPAEQGAARQAVRGLPRADVLPEELAGMVATVVMAQDICLSDKRSSLAPDLAHAIRLAADYGVGGELSLYRGFEHVNDGLPRWADERRLAPARKLPASYFVHKEFPECFPGGVQSVVRDQARCGSCWAFASASSLMTTLCTSSRGRKALRTVTVEGPCPGGRHEKAGGAGNHSNGSAGTNATCTKQVVLREEVSTQEIMACNSEKRGCNGGYASAAHDVFWKLGIVREEDDPYQCGRGSAADHFDPDKQMACQAWPWGCNPKEVCSRSKVYRPYTFIDGFSLQSEEQIKQALVGGNGVYITFVVVKEFMSYRSGVFKHECAEQDVIGGHAVNAVGYGTSPEGEPFWEIQNSWTSNWGQNGYFWILRGNNTCDVERGGVVWAAKVRGAGRGSAAEQLGYSLREKRDEAILQGKAAANGESEDESAAPRSLHGLLAGGGAALAAAAALLAAAFGLLAARKLFGARAYEPLIV